MGCYGAIAWTAGVLPNLKAVNNTVDDELDAPFSFISVDIYIVLWVSESSINFFSSIELISGLCFTFEPVEQSNIYHFFLNKFYQSLQLLI